MPRSKLVGLFAALFAVALSFASETALAGGNAAADALFREALAAAQAGDYAKAADKFKASYDLEPAPGTLQGLALAEEKLGKNASAFAHYRELMERAAAKGDKKRVKVAKDRIAAIEPHLAKLTVTAAASPPDGASMDLDGTPFPLAALGSELPMDPGSHAIKGSAPDGSSFSKRFDLAEGQKQFITVEWKAAAPSGPSEPVAAPEKPEPAQPKSDPAQSTETDLKTIGLVVGGAGVLLAAGGTYFWLQSNKTYNDVSDRCPGARCDPSLQSDVDKGKREELFARIGLGVGGAAVITGVVLYVIGSGKNRERVGTRVRPFVGLGSAGVTGQF